MRRFKRKFIPSFTLIEVLFSLFICMIILLNISSILSIAKTNTYFFKKNSSIELGVKQISQTLITAVKINILGKELKYVDENNQENTLYLDNKRIVSKPGFQIFASDVDEINFINNDNKIYLETKVKNRKNSYLIAIIVKKNDE